MSNRNMSVAGTFYPSDCSEIKKKIEEFSSKQDVKRRDLKVLAKAIISPHAGYIYSGFCANAAYSMIDTKKIKRVIIIGPSHRVYLKGASVAMYDSYISPCANLSIDLEYSKELIDKYEDFSFFPSAHHEHSSETQVPFIEHYFNSVSIVEIIYGDISPKSLIPVIEESLEDEHNLLVISTDLSHFHNLQEANERDNICIKAVKEINHLGLDDGCEACGMTGVKAMLEVCSSYGLKTQIIEYRTSYETSLDKNRVVGYMSALIF